MRNSFARSFLISYKKRTRCISFSVSWDGEAFTFDVTGYGHGVGMSQYGANAMAREGSDFEEILTWYYTGTEVGELYGAAGE